MGDNRVNVICMKWGTRFGPHYVNRLRAMVARHLSRPHRFVCFTDDARGIDKQVECQPMPVIHVPVERQVSPWKKVAAFTPGLGALEGKTLFLDLDVLVVGSIDPLFDYSDKFAIIENWTQKGAGVGNSSVFCWTAGEHTHVLERFNAEVDTLFDRFPNSQTFVSRTIGRDNLEFWPRTWVRSFKYHCLPGGPLNWLMRPRIPRDARIIAFHGSPKPEDAIAGTWPKAKPLSRIYKHVRPTPWVKELWG